MRPKPSVSWNPESVSLVLTADTRTCSNIENVIGNASCETCPFKQTIHSPIALGYGSPALARLGRRLVYVETDDQFWDLDNGSFRRREGVDGRHAHEFDGRPSAALLKWSRTVKVDRVVYSPEASDQLFPVDETGTGLNCYRPSTILPVRARGWMRIKKLLKGCFPIEAERKHVISVLGFLAQHTGRKISHSLVLTGVPGCGKSTFADLVSDIVGRQNSRTIDGHTLSGRWLNDMVDVVLLVIEEVMQGDSREVTEKLKTHQTQRYVRFEAKGKDFRSGRTADLIIVNSNHRKPLSLSPGARREFLPAFISETPSESFFTVFHKHRQHELPGFLHFLLRLNVSAFDPAAPPPMTGTKEEVVEESRPAVERRLREMIADHEGPFARDLVDPAELVPVLRAEGFHYVDSDYLRRVLKGCGAGACRSQLLVVRGHPGTAQKRRVWAVRDVARWANASSAALSAHWRRPLLEYHAESAISPGKIALFSNSHTSTTDAVGAGGRVDVSLRKSKTLAN